MASIISAGTTSSTALNMSGDTSGVLQLASNNGTVALTVATTQYIGIGITTPYVPLQVTGTIKVATGNAQGILSLGDGGGSTTNCGIYRGSAGAPTTDGNYLNLGGYDGVVFTTGNSAIASQTERMRITAGGSVQSTNGLGASSAKSQNTLYPTVMIGGSSGTTSCTNTISYYQAGGAWEPMVYFVTVSASKGDLSAVANANYVIRMTHYNGGTANSISTSGGDTGQFTLSYSNTGSATGGINTSAITATVSASYDHIVMSIQAASWAGISSIT